jgi:hypothetical protein
MGALLSVFGLKDLAYAALIAGVLAYGVYEVHHLRAEGAAHELAALKVSSDKLTEQNAKDVAAKESTWAAESKRIGDQYEATIKLQSSAISTLDSQLRHATAAASSGKAPVPGHPTASAESDGPTHLSRSVEGALEGVVAGANHDADQVIGLQDYIKSVCLNAKP